MTFCCAHPGRQAAWPVLAGLALLAGGVHAVGATPPMSVKLRRQQIPLHSDGALVHHKSAYYGEVSVGNPAQIFEVVFDTGSGHLVLPSMFCRSPTCRKHRRFKRKASQTAKDIDVDGTVVAPGQARDQITVSFGTGEVTGVFVEDRLCLGTPSATIAANSLLQVNRSRLRVVSGPLPEDTSDADPSASAPAATSTASSADGCTNIRLIAATDMTEDPFSSFSFDGVLGLGLSALSQAPAFNFLLAAASGGSWSGPSGFAQVFAVSLAPSGEDDSEITFGGWLPSRLSLGSDLSWCEVREPEAGYWQLDVRGIRVDGVELEFCRSGCRAIVDTGTSLLGVPSSLGPQLVDALRFGDASAQDPGARPCSGFGPRLEIDLGNFTIVLDPSDIARREYVEDGRQAEAALTEEQRRSCVPMVMHIDLPEPLAQKTILLGEPVLQRYYTVFDAGAGRVGFAEARRQASAAEADSGFSMLAV